MADMNEGLHIFDISDPDNIILENSYDDFNTAIDVKVSGDYAYVADALGLHILDVTDPGNILAKDSISIAGTPQALYISGKYAYVVNWSNGINVYDVSDSDNIVAKGSSSADIDSPTSIFVSGKYAFTASNGNDRLVVHELNNLDAPTFATGAASIASLQVQDSALFDSNITVRNGLSVGGTALFQDGLSSAATSTFFGNVGIGTTAPLGRLHIVGASAGEGIASLIVQNTNAYADPWTQYSQVWLDNSGSVMAWLRNDGTFQMAGAQGYVKAKNFFANNLGTASKAIFSVSGDDNTGLFSPSADNFALTTAGSERMRVDGSGNVGIGTTNPVAKLDVAGKMAQNGIVIAYLPDQVNLTGSLILGNGGLNLSHSTGNQGRYNSFFGLESGLANTTGMQNTSLGYGTLLNNTSGYRNVAGGMEALYSNTTGYHNTANGFQALYSNTAGKYNTADGEGSLSFNSSGSYNTALGSRALMYNLSDYNTAGGYEALNNHRTGGYNTAFGVYAGAGGSFNTFSNNSVFGYRTGYLLTSGSNNLLLGYQSGDNLTTGSNNIVIGYDIDASAAASANTLNIGNLIYGTGVDGTGTTLSTGSVGIGTTAPASLLHLRSAVAADDKPQLTLESEVVGRYFPSMLFKASTTGGISYGVGKIKAGFDGDNTWTKTKMIFQVPVGGATLTDVMTLNYGNVGIGTTSPVYTLDVKSSSTDIARFIGSNSTGCTLSDGGVIACSSDERLKTNIEKLIYGIDEVMALRPVEFNWLNDSATATKSLGFIAQEVETVIPKLVMTDANGYKELNTIGLIPVLARAIQEQQEQINDLKIILGADGSLETNSTSTVGLVENDGGFVSLVQNALASFGMALENGVARFTEIFADNVNTNKITAEQMCISGDDGETVCVDKDQLKTLLENTGTPKTTIKIITPAIEEESGSGNSTTTTPVIDEPREEEIIENPAGGGEVKE